MKYPRLNASAQQGRRAKHTGTDFARWRRLGRRANKLFRDADDQSSKQVFDFVQRGLTTAIVVAAAIYFLRGPTFFDDPKSWFVSAVWVMTAFGFCALSLRLVLATFIEANRFGAVLAFETVDNMQLKYRRGVRRWLGSLVAISVVAALISLGAVVGSQAATQASGSEDCSSPGSR